MRATVRTRFILVVGLGILLGLTACTATPSELPPDGDQPPLEDDTDLDVRSDLRSYIHDTYGPALVDERASLLDVARRSQDLLDAAEADNGNRVEVASEYLSARECAYGVFGSSASEHLGALEERIFDTPERIAAYFDASESFGDQFYAVSGDPLDSCDFVATASVESVDFMPADTGPTGTCASGTRIYFGNGVGTTIAGAHDSINLIRGAYMQSLQESYPDESFTFVLAYNSTRGYLNDLREVFRQKVQEAGDITEPIDEEFAMRVMRALADMRKYREDHPQFARIADAYIRALEVVHYEITTTQNHVQKYRTDLLAGNRVIVFAHSQGNLFANRARALLTADPDVGSKISSMGIVAVATPASYVDGGYVYVTANDDRVINALRLSHDVIAANLDNDPGIFNDPRDFTNHFFGESYFQQSLSSRTVIDNALNGLVAGMPHPEAEIGLGALTVTLEWGAEPDVDLHVHEPDGTHVHWRNKRGTAGFLDRDDVNSFGPEHYYVPCLTPDTENLSSYLGTYTIGVNYYRGSGPELASIQISVNGDQEIRNFTQALPSPGGPPGVNSPIPVAYVTISLEDGTLAYSITQ